MNISPISAVLKSNSGQAVFPSATCTHINPHTHTSTPTHHFAYSAAFTIKNKQCSDHFLLLKVDLATLKSSEHKLTALTKLLKIRV